MLHALSGMVVNFLLQVPQPTNQLHSKNYCGNEGVVSGLCLDVLYQDKYHQRIYGTQNW